MGEPLERHFASLDRIVKLERIAQAERADEAWRVELARIDEVTAAQLAPYRRTR